MSHRNLEYLHRKRIIYRGYPDNDEPTQDHIGGVVIINKVLMNVMSCLEVQPRLLRLDL